MLTCSVVLMSGALLRCDVVLMFSPVLMCGVVLMCCVNVNSCDDV